jgi:outer membrane protein assembly factor BamB
VLRAIRLSDGKQEYGVEIGTYTGASAALAPNFAYFGTFDYEVLAIDLRRKSIAWRYEHPRRKFPFYSSAALAGGMVVVGGRDKMVHALDASTGKMIWTFATRGRVDSSPAISGDRVFVGSNDGRLYVLDLRTGEQVWEFNTGSALVPSPAIADGRMVISTYEGVVYCFGE